MRGDYSNEDDEGSYIISTTVDMNLNIMNVDKGEVIYYGEISGEQSVERADNFLVDLSQNMLANNKITLSQGLMEELRVYLAYCINRKH